jgi:uncharacterized membrane protein YfcA
VNAAELAVATVVIAVGAAVQGGVGFGMNLVAAPLLALIDPRLVPGPAIAAAVMLTVLVAVRERAAIDRRGVAFALVGRVPGTVAGALLIASIPERGVAIAVGAAVLVAAALNVSGVRLRPTTPTLLVAGAVSGFASTVSSVGGPPMAVVYANEPGPVIRGSLSTIFVVGGVMSLCALAIVGDFGRTEALASLVLLVPGAVGFVLSRRLAAFLDTGGTRTAVLTLSVVGALVVIVKELVW